MGDLCMFLPRCHEIAKANPNDEIFLLTKQNTKADQLLKYDPYIKNIVYIDKNKIKKSFFFLVKFFFLHKFEKVYSYQYGPKYLKYIFLAKISGVKKINYYGIFKKKEDMIKKSISANESWLGYKINCYEGCLYHPIKNTKIKKSIIIGIGASGDNKRWPTEYFIELIRRINEYLPYEFILAGGNGELQIIQQIKSSLKKIKFVSLEECNVQESIDLIVNSFFFIGNDTGFMHVSACLGMKAFCLYGDTPSNDSIYNKNIIPILPYGMKEVYHDDHAMEKILVDHVMSKIKSELNLEIK